MKTLKKALAAGLTAIVLCSAASSEAATNGQPTIRMVNFKNCVEQSKTGKKEQEQFEGLKKQMETVLEEKEKALNEIGSKFNDPDYLDSLSAEAETDLKRKFRALNAEISEQQNQYYQTLQQTNFKVVQKLTDTVNAAAKNVAKNNSIDLILSEETCFFCNHDLDVTKEIVAEMDRMFEQDAKKEEPKKAA